MIYALSLFFFLLQYTNIQYVIQQTLNTLVVCSGFTCRHSLWPKQRSHLPFHLWACHMHRTSIMATPCTQKYWYSCGDHLLYSTMQVWSLGNPGKGKPKLSSIFQNYLSSRSAHEAEKDDLCEFCCLTLCKGTWSATGCKNGRQSQSKGNFKVPFLF